MQAPEAMRVVFWRDVSAIETRYIATANLACRFDGDFADGFGTEVMFPERATVTPVMSNRQRKNVLQGLREMETLPRAVFCNPSPTMPL